MSRLAAASLWIALLAAGAGPLAAQVAVTNPHGELPEEHIGDEPYYEADRRSAGSTVHPICRAFPIGIDVDESTEGVVVGIGKHGKLLAMAEHPERAGLEPDREPRPIMANPGSSSAVSMSASIRASA